MNNLFLEKLISLLPPNGVGAAPEILTSGSHGYDEKRQVFNTKLQFRPLAIVMVETSEQVSEIVKFANKYPTEIALSVRSGGHDHEGECCATDTLLIDLSKMNAVNVTWQDADVKGRTERQPIVSIGPGARFQHIIPILGEHELGIAHGTCETVGIAGYTLGGGWGPWTRRYGMACERLIGATIVLGNGDIKVLGPEAPADSPEAKLLWALRGGGGLSYGIVTELKFKAFELPEDLCSFQLFCTEDWPGRKAIEILQCWENIITGDQNPKLIGTNLKLVGRNLPSGQAPDPEAILDCMFNGYFAGTKQEVTDMITRYFGPPAENSLLVWTHRSPATGLRAAVRSKQWLFDSWDRHVPSPSQAKRLKQLAANPSADKSAIRLDDDGPAPHKITSRLADASGWDDKGRKALICALQSPLVLPETKEVDFPVTQYITLGAITGPFYSTYDKRKELPSAFPYKDRLFTIQFQAWWDQYLDSKWSRKAGCSKIEQSVLANRPGVNRAEDWIEACRDYAIPNTSGAFISFKDSSVRTETYFAESHDALREVKQTYSKDENLLFRSRKTIL